MFGDAHLAGMDSVGPVVPAQGPEGRPRGNSWASRLRRSPDVALGAVLALVAAFAVAFLPGGTPLRVGLVAPVLLVVPGYLLIQAFVVAADPRRSRATHAILAIGVSPGLVGLLALSTAVVQGGFRPVPIVAVVTVACLALAAVAVRRRTVGAPATPPPEAAVRPAV